MAKAMSYCNLDVFFEVILVGFDTKPTNPYPAAIRRIVYFASTSCLIAKK